MNTTLLIKTFERPQCARNLIESARRRYPRLPIVVIDDSREPSDFGDVEYVRTEFDIGISRARNMAADLVRTRYFFACDDDNVFTDKTDLELAERLLEENDLDMLTVKENGNDYYGTYIRMFDRIIYSTDARGVNGDVRLYDFGPNLFLMRRDKVAEFPWDERLKMGEHFPYFHKHWGKLRVGFTASVRLDHASQNNPFYQSFRRRARDYNRMYMRENGIAAIHTFWEGIITADDSPQTYARRLVSAVVRLRRRFMRLRHRFLRNFA